MLLALWLPVGDPSAVCVAEQVCVILRAAPQDGETVMESLSTSQGWGQLDGSGCHFLEAQPFCLWSNPLLSRPLLSHAAVFPSVSVSLVLHITTIVPFVSTASQTAEFNSTSLN